MSPRAADLEPETQRNLAYATLASMDDVERTVLLYWMAEHHPSMFMVVASDLRHEGSIPDGWDQAD